jgi:hypothetical protein
MTRLDTSSSRLRLALLTIGGALVVGGIVAAQTPTAPADEAVRRAVVVYEAALKGAVAVGGQKLAQQTAISFPEVTLTTAPSIVRSLRLPGYGLLFDVQAPNIEASAIVIDMLRTSREAGRPGPGPSMPVGQGRVGATGLIEADPMTRSAAGFDANALYSANVREALIDAMLDSSGVLKLGDQEHLTISASGIDSPNANPLYRERKLILTITGADLNAFQQNRITRDQAKERIVEDRF